MFFGIYAFVQLPVKTLVLCACHVRYGKYVRSRRTIVFNNAESNLVRPDVNDAYFTGASRAPPPTKASEIKRNLGFVPQ